MTSHYPKQWLSTSLTYICVTRPRWFKRYLAISKWYLWHKSWETDYFRSYCDHSYAIWMSFLLAPFCHPYTTECPSRQSFYCPDPQFRGTLESISNGYRSLLVLGWHNHYKSHKNNIFPSPLDRRSWFTEYASAYASVAEPLIKCWQSRLNAVEWGIKVQLDAFKHWGVWFC